ncbi:MAG TPA: hypothetical protein VH619_05330 [Verrucomicrobiae bacterium]|jgi:hypothetical protein|nr:hypothetical protein [Verrucomicrobiae bacterium]
MQKPAMFYPLLLLVFWTGLMLAADFVVINNSVRQALSVHFVPTIGKMVRSEMGRGSLSHRGIEIGYNYTVNGIDYTGHHYRYDDRTAAWEYNTAIDAFPQWSARKVYYNPADPADSILDPGLDGCDLLMLLFATPLNIVTLALWAAVVRGRHEKKHFAPAGGVRILKKSGVIRAQMTEFSPAAVAGSALAVTSFLAAFPVVSMGGFAPSMRMMVIVWALVFFVVAAALAWTVNRNRSGTHDLRIDEASRSVTLPQADGRRTSLTLARDEILGVCLQRRVTRNPSGNYFSYLPAVDCTGPASGSPAIKLVTWGWTEAKARPFAQWLSEQLGVEFKGVQPEQSK